MGKLTANAIKFCLAKGSGRSQALIAALEAAGAQVRVCGQALRAQKIAASDVVPQVTVHLAALTTLVTLQLRGVRADHRFIGFWALAMRIGQGPEGSRRGDAAGRQ